jgi:MoxR-like ATPase
MMEQVTATLQGNTARDKVAAIVAEVEKVFIGKRGVVDLSLAALIAGGHILLEDVPGLGKTTLAKALARALDCRFRRIQFTSDMLPSDVLGTFVFNPAKGDFLFHKGPIFSNILLADELNRTSPRTQSALLEAMNERQVTVETQTLPLEAPFFVVATQNPQELHGTYPLPESQLDRFLLSLTIGYPDEGSEKRIIGGTNDEERLHLVGKAADREDVLALQRLLPAVEVKPALIDYVYAIIAATRRSLHFELGASPRAGIQLLKGARALALVRGREYATPDDVRALAPPLLAHRLVLKGGSHLSSARTQVLSRIEELLDGIPAP